MSITAKLTPNTKLESGVGENRQVVVSFSADYANNKNAEWAIFTPMVQLSMTMKGVVADRFIIGKGYTVTFEEDES